jgi:TRAP-type mannitol/chloroaromatic compound transport system permease large subunit
VSKIADDLYEMFHVWMGPVKGGLAIGTIFLMVVISAMNGLSVAGMAIGATIALPELLRRNYDKVMVTGVIQAGSSLGILVPPSVVLVLYGMIARQPVGQLWLAGAIPGLVMAGLFMLYIYVRCKLQPNLGPSLSKQELAEVTWGKKLRLLRAGILPLVIFFSMTGMFVMGVTSLVESSAVGATTATLAALFKGRLTMNVLEVTMRKTLEVTCMFMWIILAAPKQSAARMIHINIHVTSSVLRIVTSKTFIVKRPLKSAAKVAVVAPTAELSTKLVTPMTNIPVIEKNITKGRIPARRSLNVLPQVTSDSSCFDKEGPRFGCKLQRT